MTLHLEGEGIVPDNSEAYNYRRCHHLAMEELVSAEEYQDKGSVNPDRLDPRLRGALTRADDLCRHAGGALVSKQAVAVVIVAWQLTNVGSNAIIIKEYAAELTGPKGL